MEWLKWVLDFIGALAWPIAVVTLGIMFRTELSQLFGRLTHVKVAGNEVGFGAGVAKAEQSVQDYKESAPEELVMDAKLDDVRTYPGGDPSGLVLRAWEQLADSLFALERSRAGRGRPPVRIEVALSKLDDVLDSRYVKSVYQLRDLRNKVAHAEDTPSAASALAYAEQALELQRVAEVLTKQGSGDEKPTEK